MRRVRCRGSRASVLLVVSVFLDIIAELLLLFLELLFENLVCSPDGLALEQTVDLLQRDTASLGDEEEGEEERQERESGEEHVHAVTHSLEHLLSEARNKEVKEPVAGGSGSLSQGTEVGVEEFGVDNPGGTVPGRGVDSSPQVEEEDSGDTTTIKGSTGVVLRLDDTNVSTDDPHANGAGHSTTKKQVSSSDLINKEEEPNEGHDSLDHTEDTGHQVHGVVVDTNL